MSLQTKRIYEFGPFRLDAAEHLLLRNGEAIPLQPKAFTLLLALVERHGHLVEKDELMKKVWPDTFVEEANLSTNISLIRKALGDCENGQRYIETVPKRGYRFVAGVREMGAEQAEINEAEARHTEGETLRESLTSKVYRHRKGALLALAALVIAIGGVVPVDLLRPEQLGDGVFVLALLQKAVGDLSMRPDVSSQDFSLVIARAGAMLSSKYSICISFEDLALEKQSVFFKQRLFSL
jgi:DNA-binding winged helix-turn-helix (wHTH) protein